MTPASGAHRKAQRRREAGTDSSDFFLSCDPPNSAMNANRLLACSRQVHALRTQAPTAGTTRHALAIMTGSGTRGVASLLVPPSSRTSCMVSPAQSDDGRDTFLRATEDTIRVALGQLSGAVPPPHPPAPRRAPTRRRTAASVARQSRSPRLHALPVRHKLMHRHALLLRVPVTPQRPLVGLAMGAVAAGGLTAHRDRASPLHPSSSFSLSAHVPSHRQGRILCQALSRMLMMVARLTAYCFASDDTVALVIRSASARRIAPRSSGLVFEGRPSLPPSAT